MSRSLTASLDDAARFTAWVRAVKDLLTEANFCFEPTGLTVQAMDNSHVALVHATFPKDAWDSYDAPVGITYGFSIKTLDTVLKTARKNDRLTITGQSADVATFEFGSDESGSWTIDVKTLDIEAERMAIPEAEPDATWTADSGAPFTDLVERFAVVADTLSLEFGAVADGFVANASGPEFAGHLVVSKGVVLRPGLGPKPSNDDEDGLESLLGGSTLRAGFAIKYLKNFAKGAALGGRMQMRFTADAPLVVGFEHERDGEPLETVRYYLAPKVDETELSPKRAAPTRSESSPKRARVTEAEGEDE
jgi:proliferating cell nuclear antigen